MTGLSRATLMTLLKPGTSRLTLPLLIVGVMVGSLTDAARAQNNKSDSTESTDSGFSLIQEGNRPLLSLTFSSANRFVDESRFIFEAAGKPEAFVVIEDWLASTLNNLDGFNRDKPFGLMGYLPATFPPIPEFIAFVPVESIDDAQKLIEKAPVIVKKDATLEGRYEIITPRSTIPMLIRNGYAFFPLGNSPSPEALDRELPEPAQLVATQVRQFDVSLKLDIASIPAGTRILLTNILTSGISSQLQQRDGEPEGAYRMRRAEGERGLEGLKVFLEQCNSLTLGVDVVSEEGAVNVDMVFDAIKGTDFLKEIFQSTSKPSYFIPLLDDSAAVSFSMSTLAAERDRDAWVEILEGLRLEVSRQIELNHLGPIPDENSPIGLAITALQKTMGEGHLDTFAQFYTDSSDKLAIVSAMRVKDGDAVAVGLQDLLSRINSSGGATADASATDNLAQGISQALQEIQKRCDVEIGVTEHQGITFHRIKLKSNAGPFMNVVTELFGKDAGITIGSGSSTIWGCIGGEDSFATLTGVIDQLDHALRNPTERGTPATFRMIVNVNQLVQMQQRLAGTMEATRAAAGESAEPATTEARPVATTGSENKPSTASPPNSGQAGQRRGPGSRAAQRRSQAGEIFLATMAEGDDRIEIDFRPTESGGRMRMRLEAGFVKMLGRLIASQVAPADE